MADFAEGYFESPLTTAKFDRTPEQRAERVATGIRLVRENQGGWPSDAEINEAMMMQFEDAIVGEMARRVNDAQQDESQLLEDDDMLALYYPANDQLSNELKELDSLLPLPDLDRLAS